ncbi:bifunctional rhamnulose-1-phosphate aldolase/short-chain dehydrogenase [Erythrobacter sp. QSSC1-22B]|uniref:bifunctional rhamnulose-1-phosphate aldolase/short-chain dehydrogenase n=1 Tax=Erythrobacter sp. QSSC1-22B TaxID=1860125 RepID=UPI000AEE2281|nr:bifunctional rhamnulose-1-phosphate aldolase/short-chain dehydrogenase [Erythrobacter sp. QSSC1-22B]
MPYHPTPLFLPHNQWDDDFARSLGDAELLLYRSNLLGSDLGITNFGGGNTSAKLTETDPLTNEPVDVLWVKGSGGDLGSMKLDGFSTLYLNRLGQLEQAYHGLDREDEMVAMLPHCTFGLNTRAASIDTPLHTFLAAKHIDHVHPDAVIAIAATDDSERLTHEVFGDEVGWLPWQRPGFDLGLRLRDLARGKPNIRGVVLAGHGMFSWADNAKDCYALTIELVAKAARYVNSHLEQTTPFGKPMHGALSDEAAIAEAATLMPALRAALSSDGVPKVGHLDRSDEAMEFVSSERLAELADLGTSCPDHFLRTKIKPLVLSDGADIDQALAAYRKDYSGYYERNRVESSPAMRGAEPVIVLKPGLGMMSFAKNKTTARIAGEFYRNAINVMRGAEAIGTYAALPENEAFAIEYWALEEAKLQRMPTPKKLAGRIALVTGAAGGIGFAIAQRLAADGVCIMLADIDAERLEAARAALTANHSEDAIRATLMDVTDERSVQSAFDHTALTFGGVDIVVANAGIASAAPFEETTVELWRRNQLVLAEGYFLTARAAFPLLRQMGGGSIVFVGSKNALVPSKGASAYASAKAAALHLARNLALEGAEHGIRVNTVNPDAVLKGSQIWDGAWRQERAAAYGLEDNELEGHYRDRSLLKRSVLPSDIAEAVSFFAGERSAKSTGNILNVDAGNAGAFTR